MSYLFLPCPCYAFRVGGTEGFQEEKAESQLVSMMEQWLLQIRKATGIPANGCKRESEILSHSDTFWRKIALMGNCNFSSFKVSCPSPEGCVPPELSKQFEHFPLRPPYSRAKPPNDFPLTISGLHSSSPTSPKALLHGMRCNPHLKPEMSPKWIIPRNNESDIT